VAEVIRVLAIEDEAMCRKTLVSGLSGDGFVVEVAENGTEGIERFSANPPDVVLLDMVLPDMNGPEVCRRLLETGVPVPVIMVSGLHDEDDIVRGLEMGATDYVTKPYQLAELTARIQTVLRRTGRVNGPVRSNDIEPRWETADREGFVDGPVRLDAERREVTAGGRRVQLTRREFELLSALLSPPNRVHTREELADRLWPGHGQAHTRALDAHVRRLRAKIESGSSEHRYIVTRHGVGFMFDTGGAKARSEERIKRRILGRKSGKGRRGWLPRAFRAAASAGSEPVHSVLEASVAAEVDAG
jgi:DNA-binding response OmpR family regulator